MSRKIPDRWFEIVVKPYPSGSSTTYRWAERPMAFPTFIEGRVLKGGWSDIEHALSDWKGNPEASTFTVQLNDVDGIIRTISASIGNNAFARVEAVVKFLSQVGRRANLTPRIVHRGFIQSVQLKSGRKAQITTVDVSGSAFYRLTPSKQLQKYIYNREDLTAAGVTNTPKATIGKPMNIVVGEHSDLGAVVRGGTISAEKGMIPPDDIGDMVVSSTNTVVTNTETPEIIPPPVLSIEYVGSASGNNTYWWAVSLVTATGETALSNIVTLSGMPAEFDASNYARLTWVPPTGWEAVYAAQEIAYKVWGRYNPSPNTRLDLMNNGGTFVSPEHEYHDDQDHDVPKADNPLTVGTAIITLTTPGDPTTATDSKAYGVFIHTIGYGPLIKVFGSNLAESAVPGRTDVTDQVIKPSDGAWPFANPWIELATAGGGSVRCSGFLVTGALLNQARAGNVTFCVTTCGMLDTGDATGKAISEADVGYAFIMNEFMLKNDGKGYRTGTHGPLETFSDGRTIINTDILATFQAKTVGFIGGRGSQFVFAATKPVTWQDFQQFFNNSFTCYTGQLDNGQEGVWVIDPDTDTTGAAVFRRHIELPAWLPDSQTADEEVENRGWFVYDYDPDADAYRGDPEKIEDIPSQNMYGIRDVVPQEDATKITPLEMRCTRDQTTARDAMARRIALNRIAPVYQPLPVELEGIETNVGDVVLVTHVDGNDVNGYVEAPFFIIRKRQDNTRPNLGVTLTARLISTSVSRDDTLTDEGQVIPFVLG